MAFFYNPNKTGTIFIYNYNTGMGDYTGIMTGMSTHDLCIYGNLNVTGIIFQNAVAIGTQNDAGNLSGNLYSTGSNLQNQIDTLITNLLSTGQQSYNLIIGGDTNLSGKIASTGQAAWLATNSNSINLSGNLVTTGQNLSAVKITGSSIINNPNFTGIGGAIVLLSGNTVCISGNVAGIGGGTTITATGSNNLSTADFSGIGNIGVILSGNKVLISGSAAAGAGEANTASNLGNGSGIFSSKVGVDLQFKSLIAGNNVQITGTTNDITIINKLPLSVPLSVGAVTWTNMPAALTFFNGSSAYISFMDLSPYTGVQLLINKAGTTGFAQANLHLRYLDSFNTTVANHLVLTSDDLKLRFGGIQNVFINSGFHPIISTARSGVYVSLVGISGNGVLDPIFGNIYANFM